MDKSKGHDLKRFLEEAFQENGHYTRIATEMGLREGHRPHQLAYARHIGNALLRDNVEVNEVAWPAIGLIQADTGIGKTRVLLTAAAFLSMTRGLPVVMSTFTRSLQHQMLHGKDWKIVQRLFQSLYDYTPVIAVRFGRGNFIAGSLVRSWEEERIKMGANSNQEWDALVNYLTTVQKSGNPLDATIATFREKNGDVLPVIPYAANGRRLVDADIALRSQHGEEDQAFYKAHLVNVQSNPNIVLTNHHTVMLDALLRGKLALPAADQRAALIVDEADHIHAVARSIMAVRVRVSVLMRQAVKIMGRSLESQHGMSDDDRESARVAMDRLAEGAGVMDETLSAIGEAFDWQDMAITSNVLDANPDIQACLDMPAMAIKTIRKFLKTTAGPDHHRNVLEDIIDECRRVTFVDPDAADADTGIHGNGAMRFISWSPTRHHATFCEERISANFLVFKACGRAFSYENTGEDGESATVNIGVHAGGRNPCILTSATLTSPYYPDLEHYRRENGFPAAVADSQEIVEVARFGKATFVLPAPGITEIFFRDKETNALSYNPEWTGMVSSVLRHLANKKRRTLVLAPSYDDVSKFGDMLEDAKGIAFHTRAAGGFRDYWAAFLSGGQQKMVMTPSAWEGFNPVVDGVTWCQDVVITRIPIPPPNKLVDDEIVRLMVAVSADWVDKIKAEERQKTNDLTPLTESGARFLLMQDRTAQAYRRLIQGIGRGIRDAGDSCRIWILDPRMPLGELTEEAMGRSENPDVLDLVETIGKTRTHFAAIRAAMPPRFNQQYAEHRIWFQGAVMDVCADVLEGAA